MEEPYKIILVDDEDEIRGRIASKISPDCGFEVVGTAGNGYDALDLIEKLSPRVVFTDIKMPYIDGIELAKIIRRDYPAIRIVFITGYDEFDYAREAIRLNVYSYLTKPLTQEDISRFLIELKKDLDREISENYSREQIQQRYEQSIPLVIDNIFASLAVSGVSGKAQDIEQLREYGVSLDDCPYLVASVLVERIPENWGLIEFEKFKLSVRSRLTKLLEGENYGSYNFPSNEGIVFVVKQRGRDFSREIDVVLNRMVRTTELYLAVPIDIGVSLRHQGFSEFSRAYEEAGKALSYSRFGTISHIFYFDQFGEGESHLVSFKESDSRNLEQVLRYGNEKEIFSFIETLKMEVLHDAGTAGNLNLYVLNLIGLIANYAASVGMDINELAGGDILELVGKIRNIQQLFSWVTVLVKKIREGTSTARANNAQRLFDQAINEIYRQYENPDLTMETICETLGISPSYLSQLFKKYKETTFVKFVTAIRMEKAKEFLVSTGDRIFEIAQRCGYQDVYYFSHSFKKYVGSPPKKYREQNV